MNMELGFWIAIGLVVAISLGIVVRTLRVYDKDYNMKDDAALSDLNRVFQFVSIARPNEIPDFQNRFREQRIRVSEMTDPGWRMAYTKWLNYFEKRLNERIESIAAQERKDRYAAENKPF